MWRSTKDLARDNRLVFPSANGDPDSFLVKTFLLTLTLSASAQSEPPTVISGDKDGVFYKAQPAIENTIILDANNGFFDKGKITAQGKAAPLPNEKPLISASFQSLKFLAQSEEATARWYFRTSGAGPLTIVLQFSSPLEKESKWTCTIGSQEKSFTSLDANQQTTLDFGLPSGTHILALTRKGQSKTDHLLKNITLTGAPLKEGALLRARWRPSAIHTRYQASGCPEPLMWIFESRSVSDHSSYSPITTAFGYYGATFNKDRRAAGGMNFSMWAVSQKAKTLPPLNQMPHLLATGNPDAEFSGFGHEGSGVKIRNWTPFAHQPNSVIQALRIEKNEPYHTYSGYFYDTQKKQWILYAVGNKAPKKRTASHLRASSFCEIPGPPAVERTGDQSRILERRGWFFDRDGGMHPVDSMTTKPRLQNHQIAVSPDHWFQMMTGGIEHYQVPAKVTSEFTHPLPEYLQPNKLAQLRQLPAEFGSSKADRLAKNSATITYQLDKEGPKPTGILYYGEIDALTFAARKLHGTEKGRTSEKLFASERVWSEQKDTGALSKGPNQITLTDLKPGTKYFYRLFVKNAEGKCWAPTSGSFTTLPN